MTRLVALILALVPAVASAQPWELPAPLVFARAPRTPNQYFHTPSVSEAGGPYQNHPQAELCIRKLDGTIVVLLPKLIDYSVSLDGKSIYAAQEVSRRVVDGVGPKYTSRVVRIDNPLSNPQVVEVIPPKQDVWLAFPCEVPDGIAYLSNQDNWKNPHEFYQVLTIYRANRDGTHRERIWHCGFGGVFGMSYGKTGRLLFASGENQGFRSGLGHMWSIFSVGTHGEDFGPEASAIGMMGSADPWDFPWHSSDGSLLHTHYYDTRDRGMIWVDPPILAENFQTTPTHFGDPLPPNNPRLVVEWINKIGLQLGHQRRGMYPLVRKTHYIDQNEGATDKGLVDHPRAIPGNGVLLDWTGPGDWNNNDFRICVVPDIKKPLASPTDLIEVQNDPNFHEYMGSLLVSYKDVYGHEPPTPSPKVADGTPYLSGVANSPKRPYLPPGSAYTVIGSSSCTRNEIADKAMYSEGVDTPKLVWIDPLEIAYVAIYHHQPTTMKRQADWSNNDNDHGKSGYVHGNHNGFNSEANERVGILGYVDVRHWTAPDDLEGKREVYTGASPPAGWVRLKRSDGDMDTSWASETLGDISWVPGFVNDKFENLAFTQSWHQERARLYRLDCQGCHAHNQPDRLAHYETYAGRDDYERSRFRKAKFVTYERDIQPLNLGISAEPWRMDANPQIRSLTSKTSTIDDNPNLTFNQQVLVRQWIDTFMLRAGTKNGVRIVENDKIGPYGDDVEPTLNVEWDAKGIYVGFADAQSGVDLGSFKVTRNGVDVTSEFTAFDAGEEIYTRPGLPLAGKYVATIRDVTGNQQKRERTIPTIEPDPDPDPEPLPPTATFVALEHKLGLRRTKEPDNQLDLTFQLDNLPKRKIVTVHVVHGSDGNPDRHKWSDRAGEETPDNPLGNYDLLVYDRPLSETGDGKLRFSLSQPDQSQPGAFWFTNFKVYVYFSEASGDFQFVPAVGPPKPDAPVDVEFLKARIAELEAQVAQYVARIAQAVKDLTE